MTFWISLRESIRWLESSPTPHEPTDTVVISDSTTGLFVDVRFRKDHPDTLDWAIAGIRKAGWNNLSIRLRPCAAEIRAF